ncbi:hypothetical protein Glove_109g144 [Diversispora epigaea]|uniref:RlpA-like protein double-psi beta-barrel domain-containing protein n=1 Tax=Diversispora epigaea TaxID=1348612 RepID=A0A397J2B2_9GLOM|nr:hypothetical protein Glove_109g144 [Diversispora epigaea]
MISFQKSAVLFFALALVIILLLAPASAVNVVYRAISKRGEGYRNKLDAPAKLDSPANLVNGKWKGCAKGKASYYNVGLGACGITSNDNDLIFAMPAGMFDQATPNGNPNLNPNCGRTAIVSRKVNGITKNVNVTCVDRCVGCKFGDIDLSPAAFNEIACLEEGRVDVTIYFQDDC